MPELQTEQGSSYTKFEKGMKKQACKSSEDMDTFSLKKVWAGSSFGPTKFGPKYQSFKFVWVNVSFPFGGHDCLMFNVQGGFQFGELNFW